ncbi:DUF3887 domain-containing protein [Clostridium rectalis]|uniref:DUF3887 domain-containing protein n=1 Tax=Clostridium rectalis TaxID=2040295 RepID=UPI000F62EA71|nr:DUF3887 domain-containing protein [Clostridium rectalis]
MNNKFIKKAIVVIGVLVIGGVLFSGCGKKMEEKNVSYAPIVLDNIIKSLEEKNYEKFSQNFSEEMKKAISKEKFEELVTLLNSKIGKYKEKTFVSASDSKKNNKTYTTVIYKSVYDKEEKDVLITIIFSEDKNKDKIVEGLNFKSPNLEK